MFAKYYHTRTRFHLFRSFDTFLYLKTSRKKTFKALILAQNSISIWWSCLKKLIWSYKILIKNRRFKQIILSKYATNLKTTIFQRSLKNLDLLLLLIEFYNFSILIDMIDITINTSVSCDQNYHEWQCSIIVKCLCLYHREK